MLKQLAMLATAAALCVGGGSAMAQAAAPAAGAKPAAAATPATPAATAAQTAPAAPAAAAGGGACEKQADEKKLHGAARNSFVKKCSGGAAGGDAGKACEAKAMDKNGKPLAGAAKNSFMKKCVADAK